MEWYPQGTQELKTVLEGFLSYEQFNKEIHGIIVPHAGYSYSGKIAGKAYSYLKDSNSKKAIILAPSHHVELRGLAKHKERYWETPLGKINISESNIRVKEMDLKGEHGIGNQIPFLQTIGFKEIFPIIIGSITIQESKKIAEIFSKEENTIFIISADLSHFLPYEKAVEKDEKTIEMIQDLDFKKIGQIDSCGLFPILVLMNLCKTKSWKPKLIEYKNSGDITDDKTNVVGYSSFWF